MIALCLVVVEPAILHRACKMKEERGIEYEPSTTS